MKFLKYSVGIIAGILLTLYICGKIYSREIPLVINARAADTARIKTDLLFITKECQYRNYQHLYVDYSNWFNKK